MGREATSVPALTCWPLFRLPSTATTDQNSTIVQPEALECRHSRRIHRHTFPLDPVYQAAQGNPTYPERTSVGGNYNLEAEGSYAIADHWYVGGYMDFNNSRDYASDKVGFFVRFVSPPAAHGSGNRANRALPDSGNAATADSVISGFTLHASLTFIVPRVVAKLYRPAVSFLDLYRASCSDDGLEEHGRRIDAVT